MVPLRRSSLPIWAGIAKLLQENRQRFIPDKNRCCMDKCCLYSEAWMPLSLWDHMDMSIGSKITVTGEGYKDWSSMETCQIHIYCLAWSSFWMILAYTKWQKNEHFLFNINQWFCSNNIIFLNQKARRKEKGSSHDVMSAWFSLCIQSKWPSCLLPRKTS